jgi:hypothetical protein
LGAAFGTLGANLAATFSVGALTAFVKTTVSGIDALNDLKDATGSSIENISALEDVAARTGTSFETVGTSLIKFNKALSDAKPNSQIELALKAIGLSAKELKAIDPAEALRTAAVALSGFADDGNKARIVQELFGKSLREVAPFLNDLAEKGKLNATVTTEQAKQAEKFNHELESLAKNSKDAGRAIVSDLLPPINKLFERANNAGGFLNLFKQGLKVDLDQLSAGRTSDKIQELTYEAIQLQKYLDFTKDKGLQATPGAVERMEQIRAELFKLQSDALKTGQAIREAG